MPMRETGTFETPNASKYLQQLCKHFAHKVPVDYDAERGEASLPPGPAVMTATPSSVPVTLRRPPTMSITSVTNARQHMAAPVQAKITWKG